MFQRFIDNQIDRVRSCPQAGMLGKKVFESLEASLRHTVDLVTGNTVGHLASQTETGNPLAATLPALLTKEEKNKALADIKRQLDSGAMSLPGPLVTCLTLQLEDAANAFLEALTRADSNRDAICTELLGGRPFGRIDDVTFSAGDTHNHGRSVMILCTDAGKVVYKPHDLRMDRQLFFFAKEFFDEFVGIPRTVAPKSSYGFCEFIQKRRAEGEEEARRFWYALGGMTAFAKLLGSRDLHYQNILCCGEKPYIVDLETMMAPTLSEQELFARSSEVRKGALRSPGASLLMPGRTGDMELSVLMNVTENGIAPIVDGEKVTLRPYLPAFEEGYHVAYARAVERREEIAQALEAFPSDLAVRVVLRPTQGYWEMLKKLYHHTAMASEEGRRKSGETLKKLLFECDTAMQAPVVDSEVRQMLRGDVPYFHTLANNLSLYGEGEELVPAKFSVSALGHALDTLYALDGDDERFDLAYIDHAIRMYPEKAAAKPQGLAPLRWTQQAPMSEQAAFEEALRIFDQMYTSSIPAPNGDPLWGYVGNVDDGLMICDHSLFNGLTGIAAFASACASVVDDELVQSRADYLVGQMTDELQWVLDLMENYEGTWSDVISTGEGSGIAGILTGIALIGRCSADERLMAISEDLLTFLDGADFAGCTATDRIGGLAGLVSTLCRFEEYRGHLPAIRAAADRLLELKDLQYRDMVLWKTLQTVPRALSGAGHGMAGIAEALLAAASVLDDERYASAALEALAYERSVYTRYGEKFGTWADLRDFPPKNYMHGYCSGAPGIGIMLCRIAGHGIHVDGLQILADHVQESVGRLPLNELDHLCCGNAAIAEYLLTRGDRKAAGRVLGAMHGRSMHDGGYRDLSHRGCGAMNASLFNGICGIGYEMLRYAHPSKIPPVL